RNQNLPAWITDVAGPQNRSAFLPPTLVRPGTHPDVPASPMPAERKTASRRAMQAARAIRRRRRRDAHLATPRGRGLDAQQLKEPVTFTRGLNCVDPVKVPAVRFFLSVTFTSLFAPPFRSQCRPL